VLSVVYMLAAETEGSITVSYSSGMVTFSGSVPDGVKAVAVLLFDPDGVQIAMTTCAVTNVGTFSGSIRIRLTNNGTYSVKAAIYEGGAFFAEDTLIYETFTTFNFRAFDSPTIVPITGFESGESVSEANIKRLVSEGGSLTVDGENGAKIVFDTESLNAISEQMSGSVRIEISDVSNEYQQSHSKHKPPPLMGDIGGKPCEITAG
jgi:hypothetical protein